MKSIVVFVLFVAIATASTSIDYVDEMTDDEIEAFNFRDSFSGIKKGIDSTKKEAQEVDIEFKSVVREIDFTIKKTEKAFNAVKKELESISWDQCLVETEYDRLPQVSKSNCALWRGSLESSFCLH